MGKFLILILDALIALAAVWFLFLRDHIAFSMLVAALLGLLIIFACWVYIEKRREQAKAARAIKEKQAIAAQASKDSQEIAMMAQARQAQLAAEHEARRPICTHCGKKTEPIYRHRKIDGGPDRRYHDNPLLCNKCFKPYAGVRPWNLPDAEQKP